MTLFSQATERILSFSFWDLLCLTFQVKFSKSDVRPQKYPWSAGLVLPIKKKIRGLGGRKKVFIK